MGPVHMSFVTTQQGGNIPNMRSQSQERLFPPVFKLNLVMAD